MKIDAYMKVNQMYPTTKSKKTTATKNSSMSDKVEISQFGKDYQIAKQAVSNAPEVREERVQSIKNAMASGTYSVTMEDLADRLVSNLFSE